MGILLSLTVVLVLVGFTLALTGWFLGRHQPEDMKTLTQPLSLPDRYDGQDLGNWHAAEITASKYWRH